MRHTFIMIAGLLLFTAGRTAHAQERFYWTEDGHVARGSAESWDQLIEQDLYGHKERADWARTHGNRDDVTVSTMSEDARGLCGEPARRAYEADEGAKWCSEYARAMYLLNGAIDTIVDEYWLDSETVMRSYYSLREATNVERLVSRFDVVAGWIPRNALQVEAIQPGDYLSLRNGDHSAVIVAISDDYQYIWTSEGNYGDCVKFVMRNLVIDGVLNPEIDGIGNLDTLFTEPAPVPH